MSWRTRHSSGPAPAPVVGVSGVGVASRLVSFISKSIDRSGLVVRAISILFVDAWSSLHMRMAFIECIKNSDMLLKM